MSVIPKPEQVLSRLDLKSPEEKKIGFLPSIENKKIDLEGFASPTAVDSKAFDFSTT